MSGTRTWAIVNYNHRDEIVGAIEEHAGKAKFQPTLTGIHTDRVIVEPVDGVEDIEAHVDVINFAEWASARWSQVTVEEAGR